MDVCMYIAGSEPTDAEKEVWTDVNGVLAQSGGILEQLRQYKGAANEIREVHVRIAFAFNIWKFSMNRHHCQRKTKIVCRFSRKEVKSGSF